MTTHAARFQAKKLSYSHLHKAAGVNDLKQVKELDALFWRNVQIVGDDSEAMKHLSPTEHDDSALYEAIKDEMAFSKDLPPMPASLNSFQPAPWMSQFPLRDAMIGSLLLMKELSVLDLRYDVTAEIEFAKAKLTHECRYFRDAMQSSNKPFAQEDQWLTTDEGIQTYVEKQWKAAQELVQQELPLPPH
ncbi:MAG: hypothetical protein V4735_01370 [Pseudomonadota bacterium]